MSKIDVLDLRKRLGSDGRPMTQMALAERLRVTQSTISRLESGQAPWEGPVALLLENLDAETPPIGQEAAA